MPIPILVQDSLLFVYRNSETRVMILQLAKYFEMRVSQQVPPKYWKKRRDVRLSRLIDHAYKTVPYYQELFNSAGIKPEDIRCSEDLHHLPITRKQDLQALPIEARLSSLYRISDLKHYRTTGSTGYPFDIYHDSNFKSVKSALFARCLISGRYRYPMRLLGTANEKKTDHKVYRLMRWQYISNTIEAPNFAKAIEQYRPDILYTSTSTIRPVVEYFDEHGCNIPRVKAAYTTAEGLDNRTRTLLEKYIADEVFEIYGTTESGALAWECRSHDGLHLAEDRAIFEFVDTALPDSKNLIVTSIDSLGMPLIRYEVGDLVGPPTLSDCSCGCRFRIVNKVEGRIFDTVTLASGTEVSPIHLTDAMESIRWVRRYQIVQDEVNKIQVKIQLFSDPGVVDTSEVREALRPFIEHDTRVIVDFVKSLDPPPGVKFRTVYNKLRHQKHFT